MTKHCFVKAVAQVTCQKPLCDEWFDSPCSYADETYVRAVEPDIKGLITPGEARRMSKILRRAVATSLTALAQSHVETPDAIITGTGMGCFENSEKFLVDMCKMGEEGLKPTLFMQSTHNTVSSLIAILLKCHGYNNTYSHKGISFESALLDAFVQLKSGMLRSALVGAHDEVTPFMAQVMKHSHPEYRFISESSVSTVLTTESDEFDAEMSLCELTDVRLLHRPALEELKTLLEDSPDNLLLLGINGNELNDEPYRALLDMLEYKPVTLSYKPIFGENYSSPAVAFYVACKVLEAQRIPQALLTANLRCDALVLGVTILNHVDEEWSIINLKRIG
jgi:hypothetical protein